uniref:(northern house mosquito) hypothetical protein n=1 Tax=Culex pipiens TaxID=7175 RepID=A0A8D8FGB1_CULPI
MSGWDSSHIVGVLRNGRQRPRVETAFDLAEHRLHGFSGESFCADDSAEVVIQRPYYGYGTMRNVVHVELGADGSAERGGFAFEIGWASTTVRIELLPCHVTGIAYKRGACVQQGTVS